ncbi:MAG: hypothetical protein F6K42_12590 [Leptolyngbya sp. SIO1D8]|nr:hypothetical protein [Leptolyngbya sp. SIO1D8]
MADRCADQYKDSEFWLQYFGIQPRRQMPALSDGRCDRACQGYRIPGYLKPAANSSDAITLYCPQCHGEGIYSLKALSVERTAAPPPKILSAIESESDVEPENRLIEVINLNDCSSAEILDAPGFVYIGRQAEWRGHYLHASPLANPFREGLSGDLNEVCEMFLAEKLNPALETRTGALWNYLSCFAKRVVAGEVLKLGCWHAPQRCHGYDLAAAIMQVAREGGTHD